MSIVYGAVAVIHGITDVDYVIINPAFVATSVFVVVVVVVVLLGVARAGQRVLAVGQGRQAG